MNALSIMVPAWARLMIFITPYTRASPKDISAYRPAVKTAVTTSPAIAEGSYTLRSARHRQHGWLETLDAARPDDGYLVVGQVLGHQEACLRLASLIEGDLVARYE